MAQVMAASFGPDKLFQIMFPNQNEFPSDFVQAFRRSLSVDWWDYSKVLMVSYEISSEKSDDSNTIDQTLATRRSGQTEVITGMIEWQRIGVGWEHVWNVLGWWDPRKLTTASYSNQHKAKTLQRREWQIIQACH